MRFALATVVLTATSIWAAGAQATTPRFVLVSGPPHPTPVLVAGEPKNLELLTELAGAPFAPAPVVRTLAARPRLDLALFRNWRHSEAPVHPGDASQHGWLYPRWGSRRAVVALALDGDTRPRLVPPAALALLARHGVAVHGPEYHCAVSLPGRDRPARGFGPESFNYGNDRLRAQLNWKGGILVAGERHDGGATAIVLDGGSIRLKLGWWRESDAGRLAVTGRRLDRRAPPLRARVPDGYGPSGFQPMVITFPAAGCWRIEGRAGGGRLAFTVWVARTR